MYHSFTFNLLYVSQLTILLATLYSFITVASLRTSHIGGWLGKDKLKKAYICYNINWIMVLALRMYVLFLLFFIILDLMFGTKGWVIPLLLLWNFWLVYFIWFYNTSHHCDVCLIAKYKRLCPFLSMNIIFMYLLSLIIVKSGDIFFSIYKRFLNLSNYNGWLLPQYLDISTQIHTQHFL